MVTLPGHVEVDVSEGTQAAIGDVPLPGIEQLHSRLFAVPDSDAGSIPAVGQGYIGQRIIFRANTLPECGFSNNCLTELVGIVPDPAETAVFPPPPGVTDCWLTKTPFALIVRSLDAPPEAVAFQCDSLPPNCLPITCSKGAYAVEIDGVTYRCVRRGIPAPAAVAVTDYYLQGATAAGTWVIDLRQPPSGRPLSAAGYYVSRQRRANARACARGRRQLPPRACLRRRCY